jgi:uracil-DNA glycosylase
LQISNQKKNIVFFLWGNNAKQKKKLLNIDKHLVLTTSHPSPLSAYRGFKGCKHFSKANKYLENHGIKKIIW